VLLEPLAAAGVTAIVGALWRLSNEHAGMRASMELGIKQLVSQIAGLRNELSRDIARAESVLQDHEHRIRKLENEE
jgi:hypothetical protein